MRIAAATALVVVGAAACTIQGFESGECMARDDFEFQMPFCADVVRYEACVPKFQPLFPNHTILAKDEWVRSVHTRIIALRVALENNGTLRSMGRNEQGIPGEIVERFSDNEDCFNAYKNFLCWLNFPRCDAESRSLILCRSVCENYFRSCRVRHLCWPAVI